MADEKTTIEELKTLVRDFVADRDWTSYHDPKNLAMSIAIEAAELMEHFQWLKTEELAEAAADPQTRQAIEEELSDILAYVLSFANAMKIDMSEALTAKMEKNAIKYPADVYRGKFRV
jgi:NTP pyrophosphatase (non-canonical NTP hydrolase)